MANQEHLVLFKRGVEIWNQWRNKHPEIRPDLNEADFSKDNLTGADLSGADLRRANFYVANPNLSRADLVQAKLILADLKGVNLKGADLGGADLGGADLRRADLTHADLTYTDFNQATLTDADIFNAVVGSTSFGDVNMSAVKGLETVKHQGPSSIGIDTIIKSQGNIPEIFLRKAGVPPSIIEAIPSLIGSLKPIDFYSCFISYSSKDQRFAERLYSDLQGKGVRCWFAPEDMKTGDEIRSRIDEAIRLHDKLLLVLSEHSVNSTWVKKEVEAAFEKEERQKQLVLFPVRVDDTVMQTTKAWAADIRRMRYIGDFRNWKDHNAYQKAFDRLLCDLKADAKKVAEP